jgi:hypothetical protein
VPVAAVAGVAAVGPTLTRSTCVEQATTRPDTTRATAIRRIPSGYGRRPGFARGALSARPDRARGRTDRGRSFMAQDLVTVATRGAMNGFGAGE